MNNNIKIGIERLSKTANLPRYASAGSAGMDLFADISENIILKQLSRLIIPTGIALDLPNGIEAQIRSRSGLAANYGVVVLNGVGTIDSDYKGEVKVILYNSSNQDFTIEPNMRIAQMVIASIYSVELEEKIIDKNSSKRGGSGFGSTGLGLNKDEK